MSEKVTDPVIAALLGERDAARAQVVRLREALERVMDVEPFSGDVVDWADALDRAQQIARDALA